MVLDGCVNKEELAWEDFDCAFIRASNAGRTTAR